MQKNVHLSTFDDTIMWRKHYPFKLLMFDLIKLMLKSKSSKIIYQKGKIKKRKIGSESYFLIVITLFALMTYLEFPEETTTLCLPTFKDLVLSLAKPLELVFTVYVLNFLPV